MPGTIRRRSFLCRVVIVVAAMGAAGAVRAHVQRAVAGVVKGPAAEVKVDVHDAVLLASASGAAWHSTAISPQEMDAIACPSAAVCYAVGSVNDSRGPHGIVLWTADGGTSWHSRPIRPTNLSPYEITCTGVSSCIASGFVLAGTRASRQLRGDIVATRDAGKTWRIVFSSPGLVVGSAACPRADVCYAPAYAVNPTLRGLSSRLSLLISRDGGRTWRRGGTGPRSTTGAMACPEVNTCYLVGGVNAVTDDGGRSWHSRPIGPVGTVSSITCPGIRLCYAAGSSPLNHGTREVGVIAVTRDGGATWHSRSDPKRLWDALACPTATTCFVAGNDRAGAGAAFAVTHDGGTMWRRETVVPNRPFRYPRALACGSADSCYAVGNSIVFVRR